MFTRSWPSHLGIVVVGVSESLSVPEEDEFEVPEAVEMLLAK